MKKLTLAYSPYGGRGASIAPFDLVFNEWFNPVAQGSMIGADALLLWGGEDIVAARHLYWELLPYLHDAVGDYGITLEEFFAMGKDWLKDFLDDVPSAAITTTLNEKSFRNSYKAWTGNDLRDGDAMSAAIPYCNIVLTDKYVTAQLTTSPAVARQPAIVLARLADLTDALPDLVSRRRPTK